MMCQLEASSAGHPGSASCTQHTTASCGCLSCCCAPVQAKVLPEKELLRQAAGQGVVAERMGLTPDWIIATTAFNVFQLPVRQL